MLEWILALTVGIALTQESITVLGVLTVIILLCLSAFFASSEIAIFSLGDHRIGSLVEEGAPGAETLANLKAEPRRLLVTILVGNNIVNIAMSSVATGLLGLYLTGGQSVLVATFGITALVMLFGESAPKSYAVENSESWSLRIAGPLKAAQFALYPLVVVFDRLTYWVNLLMGSKGEFETAYVSRAELQDMIEAGKQAGIFTDEEHRMLHRLLRFRNRIAKEAMVPRLDVEAVPADADLEAAAERLLAKEVTQLPVYDDNLDDVVGIVHIRDVLAALEESDPPTLTTITRDPHMVPETKPLDDLLTELQTDRRRMAIVVDEFGTTAGIVTIEDILEEIIGEVLTPTEPVPIRRVDDQTAIVRGEHPIHVVNDELGLSLPEPAEYETIAGLLLDRFGQIVAAGETLEFDEVRLIVEEVEDTRIAAVRIERIDDEQFPSLSG